MAQAKSVVRNRNTKKNDIRKIDKSKRKVQEVLSDNNDYPPALKGAKITKILSKLLDDAQQAKWSNEGTVSVDRKLKLVDWACHKALPYFDGVHRTRLEQQEDSAEKTAALKELNVTCADICRYMSITASIPRTEREPNVEERFKRDFWARKAIAYYDSSDIPISSYDVRIRRLLNDNPLSLVVALLFSLRNLSRYSGSLSDGGSHNTSADPSSPTRTSNVERAMSNIKDAKRPGKLFYYVAQCTEGIVNLVKHKDAGWPLKDMSTLDKVLDKARKEWSTLDPRNVQQVEADAVIFVLVMLADLFKYGLQQPPRLLMSYLLKTTPLRDRVQQLINPDDPLQFSSQLLRYFFENTKINGEPFRTKIQKLNSRPADF